MKTKPQLPELPEHKCPRCKSDDTVSFRRESAFAECLSCGYKSARLWKLLNAPNFPNRRD